MPDRQRIMFVDDEVIAHEINTPIQYIGDNLTFIHSVAETMIPLLGEARGLAGQISSGEDAVDPGQGFRFTL